MTLLPEVTHLAEGHRTTGNIGTLSALPLYHLHRGAGLSACRYCLQSPLTEDEKEDEDQLSNS
ncbi:hypothetical protein E2C01_096602 [Portunus trituberculatus]|uniref:Uncharacterized protein n=1 Tax=Portunus trituberculatus TaxID=210409 RepID=A0A5B7K265_PORTR|nr:hypothetical protein [Portunus trituberculatus]